MDLHPQNPQGQKKESTQLQFTGVEMGSVFLQVHTPGGSQEESLKNGCGDVARINRGRKGTFKVRKNREGRRWEIGVKGHI